MARVVGLRKMMGTGENCICWGTGDYYGIGEGGDGGRRGVLQKIQGGFISRT